MKKKQKPGQGCPNYPGPVPVNVTLRQSRVIPISKIIGPVTLRTLNKNYEVKPKHASKEKDTDRGPKTRTVKG